MTLSVYLSTLGCRLNEAELASWTRTFRARGHQLVHQAQMADLIVLNTCAVTVEAARKSRKLAGTLHRKNPGATLVLTGCMVQLETERAAALAGVDLVIGNTKKDELVDRVLQSIQLDRPSPSTTSLGGNDDGPSSHGEQNQAHAPQLVQLGKSNMDRTRAFIKVQDGCRNHCTYCVVTIARGEERSRSIHTLISEIEKLQRLGYREVVLTGVHLGGYGHDIGTTLSQLVREILAQTTIQRLRLSSLEPWDLPNDFSDLWKDQRLMPHLHLPLQSGSNSVLRRMARRCFAPKYRQLVETLRTNIPNLNLTTDLIVGFPGETDQEFQQSLAFVEEIGFGHVHIFSFSPRQGTRAYSLPNRVPDSIIRERNREMHHLAARMKKSTMNNYLNTTHHVLWEGNGTPTENGMMAFLGHTDNYFRVETEVQKDHRLRDLITSVELTGITGKLQDRFVARSL